MIAADAAPAIALSCQLLIGVLTKRAWELAKESGRNTIQEKDLISAVTTSEHFDFLTDAIDDFRRRHPS